MFKHLAIGDKVVRMLCGTIPIELYVVSIDANRLGCGLSRNSPSTWEFDIITGAEIDDDLGWGPQSGMTGSFLVPPATKEQTQ